MTLKGFFNKAKSVSIFPDYATLGPIRLQQIGLDVEAHSSYQNIGSDAVEASSTTTYINATAHAAKVGDLISFTSGALQTLEVKVWKTATNIIYVAEELPTAPVAAVTFDILRHKASLVSSAGGVTLCAPLGYAYADSVRYTYVTAAVGVVSWVQLIASTAAAINGLFIFDSSGQTLELGVGAAASESRKLIIPPGGHDGIVPLAIAAGSRIAIRALSATTGAIGEINITGLT